MAAHAYPHIVFATNAETLPRTELEALVTELFADHDPAPAVTHGPLQVELRLGDYAFTFWYDDDAEGLGGRYADFAPPLKKRRVGRCTTMIDLSGAADPDRRHAGDAQRILDALADRDDVYVFSEESKSFVGLDERDPFADAPTPVVEPEAGADDVAPPARPVDPPPTAPHPAPATAATPDPLVPEAVATARDDVATSDVYVSGDDATAPRVVVEEGPGGAARHDETPAQPAPDAAPPQPHRTDESTPTEDAATPDSTPPVEAGHEPARVDESSEEATQGGFFKRLFGRGRR